MTTKRWFQLTNKEWLLEALSKQDSDASKQLQFMMDSEIRSTSLASPIFREWYDEFAEECKPKLIQDMCNYIKDTLDELASNMQATKQVQRISLVCSLLGVVLRVYCLYSSFLKQYNDLSIALLVIPIIAYIVSSLLKSSSELAKENVIHISRAMEALKVKEILIQER